MINRCDNCKYFKVSKGNEYTFCGHEEHYGDMVACYTTCSEHEFRDNVKPCPFCGAEARILIMTYDNNVEEYKVVCPHCGISQKEYIASKDLAVTMWNRRAYK